MGCADVTSRATGLFCYVNARRVVVACNAEWKQYCSYYTGQDCLVIKTQRDIRWQYLDALPNDRDNYLTCSRSDTIASVDVTSIAVGNIVQVGYRYFGNFAHSVDLNRLSLTRARAE